MHQSRFESLKEACHNTWIGFLLSFFVQQYIITWLFNLPTTGPQNFAITMIFTVISVGRNYSVRRYNVWKAKRKGT